MRALVWALVFYCGIESLFSGDIQILMLGLLLALVGIWLERKNRAI